MFYPICFPCHVFSSSCFVDYISTNSGTGTRIGGQVRSGLYKFVYSLLPLLPIILLIVIYLISTLGGPKIDLSVEVAVLICFVIALMCELIFKRKPAEMMVGAGNFFKGMSGAFDIVVLLVAATVFVAGLKGIGLITQLQTVMETSTTTGFVLPLILVLVTALIVILSGSGTALFYSMVPLMYPLAMAAGISALAISVPMGLAGNLLRAVSPVSAVIMIVAGSTKRSPMSIVKRTAVPMILGTVFMFVLSMILFL
ncbi:MAG: C4-dicarboxylate transporter DcuC [Clostridiales bacterium]|nr:C4-dicarboxylate transporter DcuC [Clostridiales bacterium]